MILFDIARGLLITVAYSMVIGLPSTPLLIIVGVLASILPDWDYVAYWATGGKMGKWAHLHRDISHYPLITCPIVALVSYYAFGATLAVLITMCWAMNYAADSFSVGWGIRWLYPLPWIGQYYIAYRKIGDDTHARLYALTFERQHRIAERYGDEHWASNSEAWLNEGLTLAGSCIIALWWLLCW